MNNNITQAVNLLKQGKIIIFPTETVYALAADAKNHAAVQQIYQIKGRNVNNPLAIMVKDIKQAEEIVKLNEFAYKLAEKFLPGPLTIVLPRQDNNILPKNLNEGLTNLAIRVPDNKIALAILEGFGAPIVATSVNKSGQPPATDASAAYGYFGNNVELIIDGGKCACGIASTIVDLCRDKLRIIREGSLSEQDIIKALGSMAT